MPSNNYSENEGNVVKLEYQPELVINYSSSSNDNKNLTSTINSLEDFEKLLPILCCDLFKILGSKNLEATYQRALVMDLQEAGVYVAPEVSMPIIYKGKAIGTRRADIICTFTSGEKVILELKAVKKLSPENRHQLEYYMHFFKIENGYLINFPHDTGFPAILDCDDADVIVETVICGMEQMKLSDRTLRGKHSDEIPQINHYKLVKNTAKVDKHDTKSSSSKPSTSASQDKVAPLGNEKNASGNVHRVKSAVFVLTAWGKTLKGTDCKNCLKISTWCDLHLSQKPVGVTA